MRAPNVGHPGSHSTHLPTTSRLLVPLPSETSRAHPPSLLDTHLCLGLCLLS